MPLPMNNDYSLIHVIKTLLHKSKVILLSAFLVSLVTAGITLIMPNYYKGLTTFYAASPDLSSPTPIGSSSQKINVYGNDEDLDRLLSISSSSDVLDYLIDSFNLYEHYEIDRTEIKGSYKVRKKLLKLYNVIKTKYGAISLSIEDKDPSIASAMANAARNKISELSQGMVKQSQQQTLNNYYTSIIDKENTISLLSDSLAVLRTSSGVIDAETQGEVLSLNSADANFALSEAQAVLGAMKEMNIPQDSLNKIKATIAGLKSKKNNIDRTLGQFNKGISPIKSLENQLVIYNDQLSLLKERKSQLSATFNSSFTALHVVEEAQIPVVKSRPVRSLIVIGAGLLTIILVSMTILLSESLRKIDWK